MWSSSKKAAQEPIKRGYYGDLTPVQTQVFNEIKDWMLVEKLDVSGQWDDYDLLRFCRARKFVVADVKAMLTKTLTSRRDNQIDTILDEFYFPELDQVKQQFPHGYHGLDKIGRPIYIERMGAMDTQKLYTVTSVDRMERYLRHRSEDLMKIRLPVCSELAGRRVETVVAI